MTGLIFNDEDHTATYDGKPIGRVTSIIRAAGFGVDERFYGDPYYAERGSMVHRAIHLLETGRLDESSLSEVIRPYVEGWELFKIERKIEVVRSEFDVIDTTYWYCGKCDIEARELISDSNFSYRLFVDVKTGSPTEADPLQTAGYANKYRRHSPIRGCVYLDGKGGYKTKYHTDDSDYTVFLSCVNIYNRKMRGNQ